MTNQCSVCDKNFYKSSNLRQHVKRFHPDLLDQIAPKKVFKCKAMCLKCSKSFTTESNLKKHRVKFHPEEVPPRKVYNYNCKECNRNFSNLYHYRHHKKIHLDPEEVEKLLRFLNCCLCDYKCTSKSDMYDHFNQSHNINIKTQQLHFSNESDFKFWKSKVEEESHSLYVIAHGSYKTSKCVTTIYNCQHSGFYITKSIGLRDFKRGSVKMNGLCPSEMRVKIFKNDEHEVTFIDTHVGHAKVSRETKPKKMELNSKTANEVPLSCLLNNLSGSSSDRLEIVIDEIIGEPDQDHERFIQILKKSHSKSQEKLQAEKEKLKLTQLQLIEKINSFEKLEAFKKITASLEPK